ncbi:MAG: hypothetical protein DRO90_00100 [Candidatus Altiarchaeales archaeon]|nr:MAG: hypothetical protein DRO95_00365 [Candidatus Altiarchaeales archaeon]RLI93969.1 MAG: hypothetical protein DRO94_03975 [Candidatus Altiarchaeales archaeon]RLI95565.1 MAG: hypothetical protein DRO90_00100 [Candidatus Altiarchaeales archaeon]
MKIYTIIARILPVRIRAKFRQLIMYSNLNLDPDSFLGFIILFGLLSSLVFAYTLAALGMGNFILIFIVLFVLIEFSFYIIILFSIDSKTKAVEEVLPDALQLMSSNIRAGLTTDKALLLAARPEFGPLAEEIRRVGRETMTGRNLAYALMKTTTRIKSETLKRTIDLIVNSIKSGGKLADLLDQTASDLRDQEMIKKEISASVLMYVIFIFVAIAFGAPLLFAMSSFLVKILTKNMQLISEGMPSGGLEGAPISITNITLDQDFINFYAIVSLTVTSFFGSVIIGLILRGDEKYGLKYLPIMLLIAIGLFFLGNFAMESLFGKMMEVA